MDERAVRARELREAGHKWAEVADALGFANGSSAYHAAKRAGLTGTRVYANSKFHGQPQGSRLKVGQRKHQLRKYGLTLEKFDEMVEAQNGRCAICGQEEKLVVDHCHNTGEVRGLLCNKCNMGIGMLGDNPELLVIAAFYLSLLPADN